MTRAVSIREADFAADHAAIRGIRFEVFVDEQRVPADLEMDDRDMHCVHVLAFIGGEAVGTGRMDPEREGKVGRVAVVARVRRQGVGSMIMEALHRAAAERGLRAVWCHAQVSAVPFYERLGYRVTSGVFSEAGIEHVRMERSLGN